jgi:hypothetical protein
MNGRKDFGGRSHMAHVFAKLLVGVMGSETFIHLDLPNGKVDRKCPQNKATENNLFHPNFCRFGYMKLSVEKDAAEVQ